MIDINQLNGYLLTGLHLLTIIVCFRIESYSIFAVSKR